MADPTDGTNATAPAGTVVYIDPSSDTNGNGTLASPYNTWASVPTGAGVVYRQKRGTTWIGAFPSLTSGTGDGKTTVMSYATADTLWLPKPIVGIGDTIMPGGLNSPKTFMLWSDLDIRCARSSVTGDTPIMWLGSDVEISDCNLTSNLTALYGEKCSRVKLLRNKIIAATANTSTASINAIVLAGSQALDDNVIDGNDIIVGDGGPAGAHAVKVTSGVPITSLRVTNNRIRTASGQPSPHADKAGIYIGWAAGADLFGPQGTAAATIIVANNDVANLVDGVFLYTSSSVWVHHNKFDDQGSFGIHVTGNAAHPSSSCLIEWNKCRRAGRNLAPFYGRGIELSGGSALNACSNHVVRFNDCSYAKNWGGPLDNITEGVGIGLDDATSDCQVYGNLIRGTEGNAIQFYGGTSAPADTGGHVIVGNFIIDCGLRSWRNRRTAPVLTGCAAISTSKTQGSRTIIAYNVIIGGTGGVRFDQSSSNVEIFGNVFHRQTVYAITAASVASIRDNCYDPSIPKQIGNLTMDSNGTPTPALLSTGGAGDKTAATLVDDTFAALAGSPLLDKIFRKGVPFTPLMLDLVDA
ncbi:right-handed parallel beta-helix repeat-containing protein [Massilia sp. TN1-12]|uniref:right-handed parallel beta-helix repeat-containing protein n=1 Tax=Massilia paldalensis TaxID=3377675 RepID=UPI00384B2A8A